jgi:hypothetical protein
VTRQTSGKRARIMTEIGWREMAGLPDFEIAQVRAKVDTGARTSALHAVDLEVGELDGHPAVSFRLPLPGQTRGLRHTARLLDQRPIKNTGGVPEDRYVVETTLILGHRHWHIEVSLADRENMEFDLLLGRTALRGHGFLINPGRSFLAGPPTDPRVKHPIDAESGLLRTLKRGKIMAHSAPEQGNDQ